MSTTAPVRCPSCNRLIKIPEKLWGKRISCPACELSFATAPDKSAFPLPHKVEASSVAQTSEPASLYWERFQMDQTAMESALVQDPKVDNQSKLPWRIVSLFLVLAASLAVVLVILVSMARKKSESSGQSNPVRHNENQKQEAAADQIALQQSEIERLRKENQELWQKLVALHDRVHDLEKISKGKGHLEQRAGDGPADRNRPNQEQGRTSPTNLADHSWWNKKPRQTDADHIIDLITSHGNGFVFIDKNANAAWAAPEELGYRIMPSPNHIEYLCVFALASHSAEATKLAKPRIVIFLLPGRSLRYSRDEAHLLLQDALNGFDEEDREKMNKRDLDSILNMKAPKIQLQKPPPAQRGMGIPLIKERQNK